MLPFAQFNRPEPRDIPAAVDVVVIGGGIAGISTAWHLVEQGLSVVVCEKGHVAAEQSGRNWGWIRVQGRDPAEIPLVLEARHHWQDWAQLLGPDLGFTMAGVTYAARNAKEMADYADWLEKARDFGLDSRLLSTREASALIPDAAPGLWHGALHTPSDARAEPFVAVPMMAAALRERGGHVVEGCAVRALDIRAGHVVGVVTEAGRIRADAVVLTGGRGRRCCCVAMVWVCHSSVCCRRLPRQSPGPLFFRARWPTVISPSAAALMGAIRWRRDRRIGFSSGPTPFATCRRSAHWSRIAGAARAFVRWRRADTRTLGPRRGNGPRMARARSRPFVS